MGTKIRRIKIGGQNGNNNIQEKNPKRLKFNHLGFPKVSEMRLELTRSNDHYPLKVARLPIPPSGLKFICLDCQQTPWVDFCIGAKNGTRTRDPDLGKVVLYQLSYFRIGYDCVKVLLDIFKFSNS